MVDAIGKLINTTASCSPPLAQRAAEAALEADAETRDDYMDRFRRKVERLCEGLERIDGFRVLRPAGTFYVFPDVRAVCNRLGITSHGLALYLLEGADDASASPAWAANASATPGAASSASVAPSPTNASTRPSNSSPPPSGGPTASAVTSTPIPSSCWAGPIRCLEAARRSTIAARSE